MLRKLPCLALALSLAGPAPAATGYTLEHKVVVAQYEGAKVTGELYLPAHRPARHPVLIATHGGDWKYASSALYRHWGPYLAQHGYALLALDYRLVQGEKNRYPAAVDDVRAALRLIREHGVEHGLDAQRIGLIGDSAGAQVAALAALELGSSSRITSRVNSSMAPMAKAITISVTVRTVPPTRPNSSISCASRKSARRTRSPRSPRARSTAST